MKPINITAALAALAALVSACGNEKAAGTLPTIDMTKSYPEKEMTMEQLFDIEYVPLESTDEFVSGDQVCAVSDRYIVMSNNFQSPLHIFDRKTGKGIGVINRQGQGPEEYASQYIMDIMADDRNGEIWIYDQGLSNYKRYTPQGEYRGTFELPDSAETTQGASLMDNGKIVFYKRYSRMNTEDNERITIMSTDDGSVVNEFKPPYDTFEKAQVDHKDGRMSIAPVYHHIAPAAEGFLITAPQCDTIYMLGNDMTITPAMTRTPAISVMNEPKIFAMPIYASADTMLIKTIECKFDFDKMAGFESAFYVIDRRDNTITKATLTDANKLTDPKRMTKCGNYYASTISPEKILESDQLTGPLKEIAETIGEEDNPVIVIYSPKS